MTRYPALALALCLAACSSPPDGAGVENGTVEQAATCYRCLTPDAAIETHWRWLGSERSYVGDYTKHLECRGVGPYRVCDQARDPSVSSGGGRGWMQTFEHGRIYYTTATGPCDSWGKIGDTYVAIGDAAGRLGFPTTDIDNSGLHVDGMIQSFEHGEIEWLPNGDLDVRFW